jgi:ketosteroid isomerase-like protein
VALVPYLALAIANLISFVPVILSIVCVIGLAAHQSSAQQGPELQTSLSTDNQIFQKIEDRWSQAIDKRDQYALEQLLSPELTDISAIGAITTRNQQIAMLFGKGAEPLSLNLRVLNVRSFGDLAVVIGTYREQRRVNGKLMGLNGMFTHIFQKVRGNWLCVSAQRTLPVETVSQKARAREK